MLTPLFNKLTPIQDDELLVYRSALQSTQGNILKSHGRRQTANVFLSFTGAPNDLKASIRVLASLVTSAWEQSEQTCRFKSDGSQSLFVGFGLSARGYSYLGYDPTHFRSSAFQGGMSRADSGLGDPPISQWEATYRIPLMAMVLLASDVAADLDSALNNVNSMFKGQATATVEHGAAIFRGEQVIEHFGFVDGISQPLFFQSEIPPGLVNWDPSAGPNLVLIKDPYGATDNDCGSQYVYRKLRQDITGFANGLAALNGILSPGQDANLAGALVVGRFTDGTPAALNPAPSSARSATNDFIYTASGGLGADPFDLRCPVSSHIRKANPRGDTGDLSSERAHRIARRGITYGIRDQHDNVGLLFQCCQSSLEDQFEFLQGTWLRQVGAPSGSSGIDPVAGEARGDGQTWPLKWGTGQKQPLDLGPFVKLQGGGYFFLPSLTFLKNV